MDCLHAIEKAIKFNFFDFNDFDVEEYEHYEVTLIKKGRRSAIFNGTSLILVFVSSELKMVTLIGLFLASLLRFAAHIPLRTRKKVCVGQVCVTSQELELL